MYKKNASASNMYREKKKDWKVSDLERSFIREWNDSTGSLVTNDGQITLTRRCRRERAVGGEKQENWESEVHGNQYVYAAK